MRFILLSILPLLLLALFPMQARAIDVTTCGTLSTSNATYSLLNDIQDNATCITISAHNVTFEGNGHNITYAFNGSLGYGIRSTSYVNVTIQNVTISQGNGSLPNINGSNAIQLNNMSNFTIRNNSIWLKGSISYGISFDSATASMNGSVLNNYINVSGRACYGIGVSRTGSINNVIRGNVIDIYNISSSAVAAIYYGVSANYNTTIANNIITSYSPVADIMYFVSSDNFSIKNNTIVMYSGADGIYLYLGAQNNIVAGNNITSYNRSQYPIYNRASNNNSIINNIVTLYNKTDNPALVKYGIYNRISNYTLISNNTIFVNSTGAAAIQDQSWFDNVSYNNIVMAGESLYGLNFGADERNDTIAYNTVNSTANGTTQIYLIYLAGKCHDNLVTGNNLTQWGYNTIGLYATTSLRNNFSYNNITTWSPTAGARGITVVGASGSMIQNNYVWANVSDGMNIQTSNLSSIKDNYFWVNGSGPGGSGMNLGAGTLNNTFNNNIVRGFAAQAVYCLNAWNNTYTNESYMTNATGKYTLYIDNGCNMSTWYNSNIDASPTANSYAIKVDGARLKPNLTFINSTITASSAATTTTGAVWLSTTGPPSVNLTFIDSYINETASSAFGIVLAAASSNGSIELINTTKINGSRVKVSWGSTPVNFSLSESWYIDVMANWTNGTAVQGATVYTIDNAGWTILNTTDISGSARITRMEYNRTKASGAAYNYTSNFTVSCNLSYAINYSKTINLSATNNTDVSCTLSYECDDDYDCGTCQLCSPTTHSCVNEGAGLDDKGDCAETDCYSGTCDGAGSCGYISSGEGQCPACGTCDGAVNGSCVNWYEGGRDEQGVNTCTSNCYACYSGICDVIPADTDPFGDCGYVECDGDAVTPWFWGFDEVFTCKYRQDTADSDCNGAGSCKVAADYCPGNPEDGPSGTTCDCAAAEDGCTGETGGSCHNGACDTTPPGIVFMPPTPNNETTTYNYTYINLSTTESGHCLLEWNGTNQSMSESGTLFYLNKTNLSNGNYTFRAYCNDTAGNTARTSGRWVYINWTPPDTDAPDIGIIMADNGSTVDVNYTFINLSLDQLGNCTLNWNGTNGSMVDKGRYSYVNKTTQPNGNYTFRAYCNDTSGNMNSTGPYWTYINWTADTTPPSPAFVSPTPNGQIITANYTFINLSISEYSNCTLNWNGTNGSMVDKGRYSYVNKTLLGNGNYSFRAYCDDPSGNSNITETRWVYVNYTNWCSYHGCSSCTSTLAYDSESGRTATLKWVGTIWYIAWLRRGG